MAKKLLALVLSVLMLVSLLPVSVFAATEVKTETALKDAVAAGGEVTLSDSITLTSTLEVPSENTVTLDLNGYTISYDAGIAITNYGTLIINDTVGTGGVSGNYAVRGKSNSFTTINAGIFTAQECAVSTDKTVSGATFTINDGTFTTVDNSVLSGNGTNGAGNNTWTINGGTFNGNITSANYIACGIYAPNNDTWTINGGEFNITNGCGICARAGQANVTIGSDVVFTTSGTVNGWVGDSKSTVPCAAVVFDTRANYPGLDGEAAIYINDGTFVSDDSVPTVQFVNKADGETPRISVSGGTFSSAFDEELLADDAAIVQDGNGNFIVVDDEYEVEGYIVVENADGDGWIISNATEFYEIGRDAFDAPIDNTTIDEDDILWLVEECLDNGYTVADLVGATFTVEARTESKVAVAEGSYSYFVVPYLVAKSGEAVVAEMQIDNDLLNGENKIPVTLAGAGTQGDLVDVTHYIGVEEPALPEVTPGVEIETFKKVPIDENGAANVEVTGFSLFLTEPVALYPVTINFENGDDNAVLDQKFAENETVDLSDYTIGGDTIIEGDTLKPKPNATHGKKYVFDGWDVNGTNISGDTFVMPGKPAVVTAHWREANEVYTITYYNDEEDTSPRIAYAEAYTAPHIVKQPKEIEGMNFLGWVDKDGIKYQAGTQISVDDNMVLTGTWTEEPVADSYKVILPDPATVTGGTLSTSAATAFIGDWVKLTAVAEAGYEFDGFTVTGDHTEAAYTLNSKNEFQIGEKAEEDVNVTGSFTAIDYTITFDPDDGTLDTSDGKTSGLHVGDPIQIVVNAGEQVVGPLSGTYKVTADATESVDLVIAEDGSFIMPAGYVTITATATDAEAQIGDELYTTFEEALAVASAASDNSTIKILKPVMVEAVQGVNTANTITIDLNGYTIKQDTASTRLFLVARGTLVISDETGKGSIKGQDGVGYGATVQVAGGTLELTSGSILGAETSGGGMGGAVYIYSGAFNMSGGTITGGTAIYGGGVAVNAGGAFNMSGGTITGNSADLGGGVFLAEASDSPEQKYAKFNMSGNASITENTVNLYGGGVYVNSLEEFKVTGNVTIDKNGATNVYLVRASSISAKDLGTDAKIGVTLAATEENPDGVGAVTGDSAGAKYKQFTSDNKDLVVRNLSAEVTLVKPLPITVKVTNGTGAAKIDGEIVTYAVNPDAVTVEIKGNEGFTFDKIEVTSGNVTLNKVTEGAAYSFTMGSEAVVIEASFKANTYKLNFFMNIEEVETPFETYTCTYDVAYTLTQDVEREGYKLLGWDENKDAETPAYKVGDDVINLATGVGEDKSADLYAIWEANECTVTFDPDNDEDKVESKVPYDTKIDAPTTEYRKTGYTFGGWLLPGAEEKTEFPYKVVGDVTFTAKWDPITFTIHYDANGGSGNAYSVDVDFEQEAVAVTQEQSGYYREGYTIDYWSVNQDGTGTQYVPGETKVDTLMDEPGQITLWAHWAGNSYYNINKGTSEHGEIMLDATRHRPNETVTVTITPAPGYEVDVVEAVPVSGDRPTVTQSAANKNVFTFPMSASDVTVNVTYTALPQTVTFTNDGNGTVSTDGAAEVEGKLQATKHTDEVFKVTYAPADGYELDQLTYTLSSDATAYAVVEDTITMPAEAITVNATFKKLPYTITASVNPEESGTVEIKKGEATVAGGNIGDVITVNFAPATGYELDVEETTITATPVEGDPYAVAWTEIDETSGTFTMVAANVTINAAFTLTDYTITPYEKDDGAVVPAVEPVDETYTANYGDEVALEVEEVPGFVLVPDSIKVYATEDDAKTVVVTTTDDGTTFTMPAYDVTVDAEFQAAVAMIGEGDSAKYFLSLGDAIDAAVDNDTITLLASDKGNYTIDKSVTLDTNGYTVTGDTDSPVFEVSGATFTLTGSGAIAPATAKSGTGVYVADGATFAMDNGTISGFNVGVNALGTVELSGTPKITGSTTNVNLSASKTITIAGKLESGAKIGVKYGTSTGEGVFTTGFETYNSGDQPEAFFTSDEDKTIIKRASGTGTGEAELISGTLPTITINPEQTDYIESDKDSQAPGNPVNITLIEAPDADSYLKTFTIKSGDTDVTGKVNLVMTLAEDGTFNGATFDMYGADVTVSAVWASKSSTTEDVDKAAKNGSHYKGVLLPDGNYVIQEAAAGADGLDKDIQHDFTELAASIANLREGEEGNLKQKINTIVLHTDGGNKVFKFVLPDWREDGKDDGTKLVDAIAAAGLFANGKTVNLVLDGAPVDVKITVADDVVDINGATVPGVLDYKAFPAVIVTRVSADGINDELDQTAYKGVADVKYAAQVDVYADNELVHPVTLTSPIIFQLKDIDAGTYFVGNNHNGYAILGDAEGFITVAPDDNGNAYVTAADFTMYFLGVADTHQIFTAVNDATMGTLTTIPADEAIYGYNVTVDVEVEFGYHLESLTYAVGDDTHTYPIEVDQEVNQYIEHFTMPAADVTVTATFAPNTYTVKLDPGEVGSYETTPMTIEVTFGEKYGEIPEPAGALTLFQWLDEFDNEITADSTVELWWDHTLTAQYVGTYATVTYDAHLPTGTHIAAGSVDVEGTAVTAGNTIPAAENTYVIEADSGKTYTFKYWTRTKDGSGEQIFAQNDFEVNGNVTLYAQWESELVLHFDANGVELTSGTVPNDITVKRIGDAAATATIPSSSIAAQDKTFEFWSTSTTKGGDSYTAGSTYNLTADTTLYAIWSDASDYQCIVYFETGEGTPVEPWILNYEAGVASTVSLATAKTTLDHYKLTGWTCTDYETGADADPASYATDGLFTPTYGKTFVMTAVWEENAFTTFTYNKPADVEGTAPDAGKAYVGEDYTPEQANYTKKDAHVTYTHNGWVLSEADIYNQAPQKVYSTSTVYTVTADTPATVTFYPHFIVAEEGTIAITFDLGENAEWTDNSALSIALKAANGVYVTYQDATFALPVGKDVYKEGFVLNGWKEGTAATPYRPGDTYLVTGPSVLTAVWVEEADNAEIITDTLADGTYGIYYEQKLDATTTIGGTKEVPINEYFFEARSAEDTREVDASHPSNLPKGLTLTEYGTISGVPLEVGKGTYEIFVGMRDANSGALPTWKGESSVKKLTIVINPLDVQVALGLTDAYSITYGDADPTGLKSIGNLELSVKTTAGVYKVAGDTAELGSKTRLTKSIDGNNVKFTFSYDDDVTVAGPGPDPLNFVITSPSDLWENKSGAGKTKVGKYLLDVTMPTTDAAVNYTFSKAPAWANPAEDSVYYYTVNPKAVKTTWTYETQKYTSVAIEPAFDFSSYILTGDTCTGAVYYTSSDTVLVDGKPVNAGHYTATLKLEGADKDNYYLVAPDATYDFEIARRPLTDDVVKYDPALGSPFESKTYAGYALEPDVKITLEVAGIVYELNPDVDFQMSYVVPANSKGDKTDGKTERSTGKPVGAGDYEAYITGIGNFIDDSTHANGFTILKATNEVIDLVLTPNTVEYGYELKKDVNFWVTSKLAAGSAQFRWYKDQTKAQTRAEGIGIYTIDPPILVGTYYLTVVIDGTDDYTECYWSEAPLTLTIEPKAVPVTWTVPSLEYSGSAKVLTAVVDASYRVYGDTLPATLDVTYDKVPLNVGSYTATAAIPNADNEPQRNYVLDASKTKAFEITPKPITDPTVSVAISPATAEYDATAKAANDYLTVSDSQTGVDLVYGTDYDVEWSGNLTDAGTYKATIKGLGNYYLVATDAVAFEITPKAVTVTGWTDTNDHTETNKESWIYAYGAPLAPVPTLSGIFDADKELVVASSAIYTINPDAVITTRPLPVASYNAKPVLTGDKAGNYVASGSLLINIEKATITVVVNDAYKFEGDADPDPLTTLTITPETITAADLVYTLSREAGEDVKTYTITLTITDAANPNYIISGESVKTATFEIKAKAAPAHVHGNWAYTVSGDTITATCGAAGCTDPATAYKLTIVKPAKTSTSDSLSALATLKGLEAFNEATGMSIKDSNILYFNGSEQLESAPTTAGTYTAAISAQSVTATVTYTISSGGSAPVIIGGGSSGSGLTMTLLDTVNGTINFQGKDVSVRSKSINNSETVKLEVKPAANYKIDSVTYTFAPKYDTAKTATEISEGVYQIIVENASIKVSATFKPINDNDPSVGRLTISNYTNGYATCPKDFTCLLTKFDDMKDPNVWYHDGVHYCLENGIMQGFGDPYFRPYDITTRAQVVTTLWNIAGHPIATSGVVFTDVNYGDWFYDAIMWAAANGIVEGYGDGTFRPNQQITHEEMAKIFCGYAQFYGLYDESVKVDISGMPGYENVSEWAVPFIQWAVGADICCGVNGNTSLIAAPEKANRAELATFILNFCTKVVNKPAAQQ